MGVRIWRFIINFRSDYAVTVSDITYVGRSTALFSQGKTHEFTKKGEIHELFVLALFLVWFAGELLSETKNFPGN